ncbi:MAG TPA: peptide chain release factor 1 [Patescibacteria group bacterium]
MSDYLKTQIKDLENKISEAKRLLEDPLMSELAKEEIKQLEVQKLTLEKIINTPRSQSGTQNPSSIILEIRAAAGGDEAGLFASDLYRMYTKYAATKKWKIEELDKNEGGLGNIKEVVAKISGPSVFDKLKYESGVHRVQRVPETESGGRIHTSTATVAVLPEVAPTQVEVNPADIEFEAFRSGGHGGQNVNKVSTAVRIKHIPSGIVVKAQTERSQSQNREIAMQILRARIYQMEEEKRQSQIGGQRASQLGSGDRSEKIRTYNYPQNRLTDHRVGRSYHNLSVILDGDIEKILVDLKTAEQEEK